VKFVKIPLIVALAILISCGARAKIMSGAFAACAEADLGQIVDSVKGTTLESAVAAIIESNTAALETALAALAAVVGIDAIDCAIAAVEAAFPETATTTPPAAGSAAGSGSGSAVLTSQTPTAPNTRLARDAGLARAHQFVKDWRAGKRPAAVAK
jgi:hypothetical protein